MLIDGFLCFKNGSVKVRFTQFATVLIAYCIERNDVSIVVLVARLFLQRTVYIR